METIKQTPNLEFDVIYADGTRKRVKEGLLYEAEESGYMIFHNGTDQPAVLLAAAECMLVSLSRIGYGLEALAAGMVLSEKPCAALLRLAKCAVKALGLDSAEKQACFRLGQMDMRESIAAMLRDRAADSPDAIRSALEAVAAEVSSMEVPNENARE